MDFSGSFRRLTLHILGSTLKKVGPLFVYMIRKNYICGKAKVMNEHVKESMSIYCRLIWVEDVDARIHWRNNTSDKTFVLVQMVPLDFRLKSLS